MRVAGLVAAYVRTNAEVLSHHFTGKKAEVEENGKVKVL